uniref:Alcohol dehydrogenase 2-like isoform X1 n=1 Tax=Diabrotica virgifera virgifera TaxID=50390 RepID=A0A6P7FLL1_DIAVI
MVFEIKNKVALITGGASGLGLEHVKALLENGVKGVTIADVNEANGTKVTAELQEKYGKNRVIFVKTDVTDKESFENAFLATVSAFRYIDILINNAGVMLDVNMSLAVDINVKGTLNGIILGMEKYLKQYKQGSEAVILNTSSINGVNGMPIAPVYGATKFAVTGMTMCWSDPFHYERTKVRVIAICPGITETPLVANCIKPETLVTPEYYKPYKLAVEAGLLPMQKADHVGKEMIGVLKYAPNGTLWVIEAGAPAYQFIIEERNVFKNNVLKTS